jgi:glycosyltransferase involved in cell wall biosynthesis
LADRVIFSGMQRDVRPFLWAADVFPFPSAYEVFSLAMLQAAAAALPLLVTQISGTNEFFEHGVHGLAVTREPTDIAAGLAKMVDMGDDERRALGRAAQQAVQQFDVPTYVERWRRLYGEILANVGSDG